MPRNASALAAFQVSRTPRALPSVLDSNVFSAIAQAMEVECAHGDATRTSTTSHTVFDSVAVASFTPRDYLARLVQWGRFTSEKGLLLAAIYVRRMREMSGLALTSFNVHRILITALVIMVKYNSDVHYCNTWYARVGGIPLAEMNQMEAAFLQAMNWECGVSIAEYSEFRQSLLAWYTANTVSRTTTGDEREKTADGCEMDDADRRLSTLTEVSQVSSNGISDAPSTP
eukprot:TRINITY_DN9193_c0_g1_i1.p1 TRINITY_DN9193_c0_g1~~TRINITY_DN9193_c0_g1_i1.p1  ORF type:complete len:255 (+),score=50.62 TRINITY_DN9193_c0_g1_i1:81-767(+)